MPLKRIIWIYIAVFTLASAIVVYIAQANLGASRTIESHWQQFQQDSSARDHALNTIFHNIGFGGAIDEYKLYILQGGPQRPDQIRHKLHSAHTAIEKYKSLPISRAESVALEQIQATLELYEEKIPLIGAMLTQGLNAHQIDTKVRIDDSQSFVALQTLANIETHSTTKESKAHILHRLRRTLGYGGITHNLYNYLLRGERVYRDATWNSIRDANLILSTYQTRVLSNDEADALNALQASIQAYTERLGSIEQLRNAAKLSANDISKQLIIDREPILYAFRKLEHSILIENEQAAVQLQGALAAITISSQLMLYLSLGFTLILVLSLYWIINNRIVHPLGILSRITDRLAQDDTQVEVPLTEQKNEIGILARSIEVFKKNILLKQQAEEALRQHNLDLEGQVKHESQQVDFYSRHLSNLLENAADAIITANARGEIISFNQAACSAFGYSAEEILGKNVSILMPETFARKHDQYLHHFFQSGRARIMGSGQELKGKRKSGEEFPIITTLSSIDDNGTIYVTAFIRDITQLKEQEKQLRHAQKMDALGQLTGGIAHDYNNMLGIIRGFSELLENEIQADSTAKQYAEQIRLAANRSIKLTSKLLDFSRREINEPELIEINQILKEQQHMLEKALMTDIRLTLSMCEQASLSWIDPGELSDAILNMSINAMHAMKNGGELKISTQIVAPPTAIKQPTAATYILITIQDNGSGIPVDVQHRIFDPYFSTKGERGNGLGLSQVYGFVQRSHGHIEFTSTTAGTSFYIYLPEYTEVSESSATEDSNIKLSAFSGMESILIVDDEPSLRVLTSEMLLPHGYSVTTANNAAEAQELLQQQTFSLALCDIMMPGMNGYELAAWIQTHYPDCKIQLISGYDKHGKHHDVDEALKKSLLLKPFSSMELLQTIRNKLDEV